jgi:hypothetical protein
MGSVDWLVLWILAGEIARRQLAGSDPLIVCKSEDE